jgi:bifunctional UDP-N-acetylglucosamine pyrophosphorylase/glucosamine-1-phosphate N-acetyltransferase
MARSRTRGKICAVILAAGEGTRMRSRRSKVLHEVAGKSIVAHGVSAVKRAGVSRIVLVAGRNRRDLESLFAGEAKVVFQRERLGTGHALACAVAALGRFEGDLLVVAGDAPLIRPETLRVLIRRHRKEGAEASILSARVEHPAGYGRIVRDGLGRVTAIREELDAAAWERSIHEVNSGTYVFRAPAARRVLRKVRPLNRKQEYYLTDAVEILVREGDGVKAHMLASETEISGINTRNDLAKASEAMWKRNVDYHLGRGVTVISPANTCIESDVHIGADTVIHPFTYIEHDVRIGRDCVIGPFAKVRSGSRIENGAVVGSFVEIVRTKLGRRTYVKHLAYLGDAAVGAGVNIGAGTITANFDGKKKNRTVIGDGAFIGCDTVLIAPVSVGRGARTGAGSVVLRGRNVKPRETVAGVPAKPLKGKGRGKKKSRIR